MTSLDTAKSCDFFKCPAQKLSVYIGFTSGEGFFARLDFREVWDGRESMLMSLARFAYGRSILLIVVDDIPFDAGEKKSLGQGSHNAGTEQSIQKLVLYIFQVLPNKESFPKVRFSIF